MLDKLRATYNKRTFHFKTPSGTSRGVLTEKHAWFLELYNELNPAVKGIGECSIIPGLSPDFISFEQYEAKLDELCNDLSTDLTEYPSIKFGLESALLDLQNGGEQIYFDNAFSRGQHLIPINGLIWMGDQSYLNQQIDEKIASGFKTIKMKIGAIDFDTEIDVLAGIRKRYSADYITLRVDANGAFALSEALDKLNRLSELEIHSIEQPIKEKQWEEMKKLCAITPVPISLDEELIGINRYEEKVRMLETIQPQYIILKPSLHGGISGTQEWIKIAEEHNIPWWMTSALESNIGLKAIAQLTAEYNNPLPQGLGTGSLYTDNIPSDLVIINGHLTVK